MPLQHELTLYHAPNTRSSGVVTLLEELKAPYRLHVIDMTAGEQRNPDYLAVNPLGKVPALLYGPALVTEQVAIYLFLADLFPDVGLAPAIESIDRGPYLRWFALYGSCFEPAIVDRAMKRDPGPAGMSVYGDFDALIEMIAARLREAPYLLGQDLSAADLLWGAALSWVMGFKLLPERPEFLAYAQRISERPAAKGTRERDAALAETQAAAAAARAVAAAP